MRTTLTLDPDVAKLAVRVKRGRGTSLEAIINEALRHGLRIMDTPTEQPEVYRTSSADLGRCRIGSLDDIADVLAIVEGEGHRLSSSTPIFSATRGRFLRSARERAHVARRADQFCCTGGPTVALSQSSGHGLTMDVQILAAGGAESPLDIGGRGESAH